MHPGLPATEPGRGSATGPPLERQVRLAAVAVLLGLAAVAWIFTIRQATSMGAMATGVGQLGAWPVAALTAAVFWPMWLSMLVAMMFPTIAPMVLAHRLVLRSRGAGWVPTAAFVAGYLVIWTVIGAVPFALWLGVGRLSMGLPTWLSWAAGGALALAGLYQLTPLKGTCLRHCRSPLHFVLVHDFGGGWRSSARAGISHGAYCIGCCWALMAVLLVVGLMNLAWMAALSAIFLAEKAWRYGQVVRVAVSVALVALGIAILIHPDLLVLISTGRQAGSGGSM